MTACACPPGGVRGASSAVEQPAVPANVRHRRRCRSRAHDIATRIRGFMGDPDAPLRCPNTERPDLLRTTRAPHDSRSNTVPQCVGNEAEQRTTGCDATEPFNDMPSPFRRASVTRALLNTVMMCPSKRRARVTEPSTVTPDSYAEADDHRVTVEMAGHNVMVRSMATIDLTYTADLVDVVNAAAQTGAVVVIDPEQIPCDAALAASRQWDSNTPCLDDDSCRPTDVEIVASGVIRVAGRTCWWTIDVASGRFCRSNDPIDCRFVSSTAWTPLIAIWITPKRLSALTTTGSVITSTRAHRANSHGACRQSNVATRHVELTRRIPTRSDQPRRVSF